MSEIEKAFFSIITVCFNAEMDIEKTINSVLNQKCKDYEYIIIDGKSSDGTLQVCNKYQTEFKKKNINYKIVSENDEGIYDAMNKGFLLAQGEWISYMNAGDIYYSADILANLKDKINTADDVAYGDTILKYEGKEKTLYKLNRCPNLAELKERMIICHQSLFIKKKVMSQFDTKYRISADYNQVLGLYLQNKEFHYIQYPISIYQMNGVSEQNLSLLNQEACEIQFNYHIIGAKEYEKRITQIKRERENLVKKWLKDHMLKRFFQWKEYKKNLKMGFTDELPVMEWRY